MREGGTRRIIGQGKEEVEGGSRGKGQRADVPGLEAGGFEVNTLIFQDELR